MLCFWKWTQATTIFIPEALLLGGGLATSQKLISCCMAYHAEIPLWFMGIYLSQQGLLMLFGYEIAYVSDWSLWNGFQQFVEGSFCFPSMQVVSQLAAGDALAQWWPRYGVVVMILKSSVMTSSFDVSLSFWEFKLLTPGNNTNMDFYSYIYYRKILMFDAQVNFICFIWAINIRMRSWLG